MAITKTGSGFLPPRIVREAISHLYFIFSGLWLWARWKARCLLGLGKPDPERELAALAVRFRNYLNLLERWQILTLEFVGFEEAHTWGSSLLAPNHPSILDAVMLMSRVPRLNCVMNARLEANPIMAGAAHLCDFVNNTGPLATVKSICHRLQQGFNILLFPEGTRTKRPPVDPFHRAYTVAATRAGAPVRTILIECDSNYFGRDFYFFKPSPGTIHYRITAGRVFETGPQTDPAALSAEIERYFHETLGRGFSK